MSNSESSAPLPETQCIQDSKQSIRAVPYSPLRASDTETAKARPDLFDGLGDLPSSSSPLQPLPNIEVHRWQDSPVTQARDHHERLESLSKQDSTFPASSLCAVSSSDIAASDSTLSRHHGRRRVSDSPSPSPSSHRRKTIYVHPDKTFSLVPFEDSTSARTPSRSTPRNSGATARSSLYSRQSSGAFSQDTPSSPLTTLIEDSASEAPVLSSPAVKAEDWRLASSPWDYRLSTSARKFRGKPAPEEAESQSSASQHSGAADVLLPEHTPTESVRNQVLGSKNSFESQSNSTTSERTNYKIYSRSSPVLGLSQIGSFNASDPDSFPPSTSHSNYEFHGALSFSEATDDRSANDQSRPPTHDSDANFVVHNASTPPSNSSLVTTRSRQRSEYSRQSLLVAPLRPVKRRSADSFRITKSSSRDSLRSISSISSALAQEATRALFATSPSSVVASGSLSKNNSRGSASNRASMAGSLYPRQWNTHLSTVPSESEGDVDNFSRSLSPFASSAGRRSSGFRSLNDPRSVGTLSVIEQEVAFDSLSQYRRNSPERPQSAYLRTVFREASNSNLRLIRDHDEDGDGLADLEDTQLHMPRSRLGRHGSEHSLRSNTSYHIQFKHIPAWARVYYGSGEHRRLLATKPSLDSLASESCAANPPSRTGSFLSRSGSVDRIMRAMDSSRRRDQDAPGRIRRLRGLQPSRAGTMPGAHHKRSVEAFMNPVVSMVHNIRKQTSSTWSPHLVQDGRHSEYNLWHPPPEAWPKTSPLMLRRNIQIPLFFLGFLCPFAWFVAAFLPLPPNPHVEMMERMRSTSELRLITESTMQVHSLQTARYYGVCWWRNLNRGMSLVGIIVIFLAVTLANIGINQKW